MYEQVSSLPARMYNAGYGADPKTGELRLWFRLKTDKKEHIVDIPAEDVAKLSLLIDQYLADMKKG